MRCLRTLGFAAALVAVCVASFPGRALADPVEVLSQFAVDPAHPDVRVLRYDYGGGGLVFSRDGGASWQLMCATGLMPAGGDSAPALGRVAFDGEGHLYIATFGALLRDDATGCAWSTDGPFDGKWVSDVTPHPSDPTVVFAITSTGGEGQTNGVYRRDADGSWEALGTQEAILISRLHVVDLGGGALRFYVGGVNGTLGTAPNEKPNYVIRVSDDLGETWTEHAFGETDGNLRLEAIDPTNPDRLVVVIDHESSSGVAVALDQIMVSDDQGATFSEWAGAVSFGGLAFAPDGRVWFGDGGDPAVSSGDKGLYFAASLDAVPAQVNGDLQVTCVDYVEAADELFVCSKFSAGTADLDTGEVTDQFSFNEVEDFVACADKDVCAACARQLLGNWCGGITHFPESKVCCCYNPEERALDPMDYTPGSTSGFQIECPDYGAVISGADGGAIGGAGGDVGAVGAQAGASGDAAGSAGAVAGSSGGSKSPGGCSCSVLAPRTGNTRASRAPLAPALVVVSLLALVLARGSARRRRP